MAEVRPFRALRYDPARVDPALAIAPPYDVISPAQQRALYERSAHNIVRIEYGEQRDSDTGSDNRYTRAAGDLRSWRSSGVLARDERPAIYEYRIEYDWGGRGHVRRHHFGVVRLEPWETGVVKPHEHTLSGPKADRLELLRATRTQVSPVFVLYVGRSGGGALPGGGEELYDLHADDQRHVLSAIRDEAAVEAIVSRLRDADFYIADGHHRYETALRYRDECRAAAGSAWTGEEPGNFVLMAMTEASDPGLLVLPTHRLINPPSMPADAIGELSRHFDVEDAGSIDEADVLEHSLAHTPKSKTAFVALGLVAGRAHRLTLRDRAKVEALMPAEQPAVWKRLDVNVLQYGILNGVFGIDDAALTAGGSVTYTQDAVEAGDAVRDGRARLAFLLRATPVQQVIDVSDVGGKMPQKSTFFHPKLPTGLVLNVLD